MLLVLMILIGGLKLFEHSSVHYFLIAQMIYIRNCRRLSLKDYHIQVPSA